MQLPEFTLIIDITTFSDGKTERKLKNEIYKRKLKLIRK